jgi:hypothetical protein
MTNSPSDCKSLREATLKDGWQRYVVISREETFAILQPVVDDVADEVNREVAEAQIG